MTDKTTKPVSHEEEEIKKLSDLELAGNNADDEDADFDEHEPSVDKTDYSAFTKSDFVNKANELVFMPNIKEAHDAFKKMRILFDEIVKREREGLLQAFVAAGNEPREFKVPIDEQKNAFYKAYTRLLERRAQEKQRAEEEKIKNLKEKKAILERIKVLTESEETENSLDELKTLQQQWRQIRRIPREQMDELWETYRFLLDKFYDNLSIYNELKDLDRQKNLEAKIDLTKKMGELMEENSVKKSHILLNKLHEDFKNIGPVPKEFSEEVWQRFKAASDKVIEKNRKVMEDLKEKRKQNLDLKTVLCEKIEQIAALQYTNAKEWNNQSTAIETLFEEWKKIGPVPEFMSDQIWKRFREAQNTFFKNRKEFYAGLNQDKEKNYKLKLALCEQAEKLSDSQDFEKTGLELIQLQEKWKTIGPVNDKLSNEIWGRFRAACDAFFKRRDIHRSVIKEEEKINLEKKQELLARLEALLALEPTTDNSIIDQLRTIQREWSGVGFVPRAKFQGINTRYEKLSDEILAKNNLSNEAFKQSRQKEYYEMMAQKPNGKVSLKAEERKVGDRMRVLQSEISTFENNIGFFAHSKGADSLKKQFEDKIAKTQAQIKKLESELKLIRSFLK